LDEPSSCPLLVEKDASTDDAHLGRSVDQSGACITSRSQESWRNSVPRKPYYRSNAMNAIPEEPEELDLQIETRPIYDYIKVRPYGEQQIPIAAEEMDEEGEVDDESDVNDSDLDEDERIEAMAAVLISDDDVIASRSVSREGSPMGWS